MSSPMTNAWCQYYPAQGMVRDPVPNAKHGIWGPLESRAATLYNIGVENTDWSDVAASLRGDDEAYGRLVRRYERPITGLLWRFTRDPNQCEELVQQVFVEAYFSLKTSLGDAALQP